MGSGSPIHREFVWWSATESSIVGCTKTLSPLRLAISQGTTVANCSGVMVTWNIALAWGPTGRACKAPTLTPRCRGSASWIRSAVGRVMASK